MGAAGHVLLASRHGCAWPPAHGTCALESIDLATGRPIATAELPAGRIPVWGDVPSPVFSPGSTLAAFQRLWAATSPRLEEASLPRRVIGSS